MKNFIAATGLFCLLGTVVAADHLSVAEYNALSNDQKIGMVDEALPIDRGDRNDLLDLYRRLTIEKFDFAGYIQEEISGNKIVDLLVRVNDECRNSARYIIKYQREGGDRTDLKRTIRSIHSSLLKKRGDLIRESEINKRNKLKEMKKVLHNVNIVLPELGKIVGSFLGDYVDGLPSEEQLRGMDAVSIEEISKLRAAIDLGVVNAAFTALEESANSLADLLVREVASGTLLNETNDLRRSLEKLRQLLSKVRSGLIEKATMDNLSGSDLFLLTELVRQELCRYHDGDLLPLDDGSAHACVIDGGVDGGDAGTTVAFDRYYLLDQILIWSGKGRDGFKNNLNVIKAVNGAIRRLHEGVRNRNIHYWPQWFRTVDQVNRKVTNDIAMSNDVNDYLLPELDEHGHTTDPAARAIYGI